MMKLSLVAIPAARQRLCSSWFVPEPSPREMNALPDAATLFNASAALVAPATIAVFSLGPTTTVSVSAADAAALERGELDPMQAFMAGRIQVAGDMTLLMQMQAIQMQAAAMAQAKKT